jgi:hypothetical protein
VSDGTYIGFLVLTLIGAILSWTLVNAKDVIREDGSKVILMKHPSWKSEIVGLYETFVTDPYILLLFPMFLSSNWFYSYQFGDINGAKFNTRTLSLNNVIYYTFQIIGAFIFGYFLDMKSIKRTTRAKAGWLALLVLTFAIWGGGYAFQKTYTRADIAMGTDTPDDLSDDYPVLDWTSPGYGGPFVLYIFYGFYDAAWQTYIYW